MIFRKSMVFCHKSSCLFDSIRATGRFWLFLPVKIFYRRKFKFHRKSRTQRGKHKRVHVKQIHFVKIRHIFFLPPCSDGRYCPICEGTRPLYRQHINILCCCRIGAEYFICRLLKGYIHIVCQNEIFAVLHSIWKSSLQNITVFIL